MKKLILLIVLLLLAGCDERISKDAMAINLLGMSNRYHDSELEVTCWTYGDGFTCIPDWMLEPPQKIKRECKPLADILVELFGSPSESGVPDGWYFYDNDERGGYDQLKRIVLCASDWLIEDNR